MVHASSISWLQEFAPRARTLQPLLAEADPEDLNHLAQSPLWPKYKQFVQEVLALENPGQAQRARQALCLCLSGREPDPQPLRQTLQAEVLESAQLHRNAEFLHRLEQTTQQWERLQVGRPELKEILRHDDLTVLCRQWRLRPMEPPAGGFHAFTAPESLRIFELAPPYRARRRITLERVQNLIRALSNQSTPQRLALFVYRGPYGDWKLRPGEAWFILRDPPDKLDAQRLFLLLRNVG